jgi:hypothetical protein
MTLKREEIPSLQEIDMASEEGTVPFPFINMTPGSATDSAHSRLLVRSHVGSWIWQQTKQNSGASDSDKVGDGHTQGVKLSTHRADWNSIKPEVATSTSPSAVTDNGPDLPRSNTTRGVYASGLNGAQYPIDSIGVGFFDPFQTYPSNNLPPAVANWCIKYCKYHGSLWR